MAGGYGSAGVGGYTVGNTNASASGDGDFSTSNKKGFLEYSRLKKFYTDYLGSKRQEIDEQQDARRFRHASQWTASEISQLNARNQPITTINKVSRKIHGVIGVLARLKQDPKAYPRTPKHEQGAELATAVLRYVLDNNQFDATDYFCGEMAAIDGIAGVEINLVDGKTEEPEIEVVPFNTDSFFYDPRSYKPDFSDARFMGVGRWLDLDEVKELFPDKADEVEESGSGSHEWTSDPDREHNWYAQEAGTKRVRVIECWYKNQSEWRYAIFTANLMLKEGLSYLRDDNDKTVCKYIAFSAYVDQDGDRYGFVRDLRPLQRELNMRHSKALYTSLGRRVKFEKGAFSNVNEARKEASRVDGMVEVNPGFWDKMDFDDQMRMAETNAQFQFLENVAKEIESFGPNVAITTGEGLENASGRAIHLLQQAGLADLGPFLQSYRGWKVRLYRAIWEAVRHNWKEERYIRVTDDEDMTDFIQTNGVEYDEWGVPTFVNKLGDLDVDIILDEGPDTVNAQADAYDTLEVLASRGAEIPPEVLVELSPLPQSLKQRLLKKLDPPPTPEKKQAMELELRGKEAEVGVDEASAELKRAQAYKAFVEANNPQEAAQTIEQPPNPLLEQAEIAEKQAGAEAKQAQAKATMAKVQIDSQKAQADMALAARKQQGDQQVQQAQVAQTQAQTAETSMDTQMRPYEVQQADYKQGMDYALQKEQIKNKASQGSGE